LKSTEYAAEEVTKKQDQLPFPCLDAATECKKSHDLNAEASSPFLLPKKDSLEDNTSEDGDGSLWMSRILKQGRQVVASSDDDEAPTNDQNTMIGSVDLREATGISTTPQYVYAKLFWFLLKLVWFVCILTLFVPVPTSFRLVVQSSPPYQVIHANKAFSVLSGISAIEVLGKPIESILKFSSSSCPDDKDKTTKGCDSYFDGVLDYYFGCSSPSTSISSNSSSCSSTWSSILPPLLRHVCMACQAHVVPIVDQSRRPTSTIASSSKPTGEQSPPTISHLLIQLHQDMNVPCPATTTTKKCLSPSPSHSVNFRMELIG
jgi:hypothetical protein